MVHILNSSQFTKSDVEDLIHAAKEFKKPGLVVYRDITALRVVNFFCEPSTRTRLSFEVAAQNIGLKTVTIADKEGSSVIKGETLEDTIKVLSKYGDAIVLRHPEVGAATRAAEVSEVPIINAGDGENEHPTQALLDLMTISEHKPLEDLKIMIVGDLKYGRTVHSLVNLLKLFNAKIYVSSNRNLAVPSELLPHVIVTEDRDGSSHPHPAKILKEVDVVYMTRIQTERNHFHTADPYPIKIGPGTIASMKADSLVMHPGPRNDEISTLVDNDPRMVMLEQVKNGIYMRMAALNYVLNLNIIKLRN